MNDALDSFSQPIASTSKFPDALDPPSSQPSAQKPRHSSNKARLLWRGSLLSDTGVKLHGIAFVAEWPENKQSTSTRPPLLRHSSGHLPIDDPFISPERQAGLQLHTPAQCEADGNLTLGIEMLRHQDLHIQRSVELLQQSNIASTAVQVNKRKRGSLKSRIESLKKGNDRVVELADATYNPDGLSIRVYVDPRCSTSRDWFSKRFCDHMVDAAGKTPRGLLLELPSSEGLASSTYLIIYGLLDESAGVMHLRVGRKKAAPPASKARPDDPLPRESLFAQKLRRSTSEPVLPLVEVSASKLPEPTKTASSALFLAKNKTFSSIAPHHTIPSARNPFAQESDNKKRKESSAPPTPGRGRGGKKAKRSDAFADLPNVAEVEEDQLAPTPMPETNGAVDYEEANIKLIKRIVGAEIVKWDIPRQSQEYRELHTATSRGVVFALRDKMKTSHIHKQRVVGLTATHLQMYMHYA